MTFLKWLLLPFAWLYGEIMRIRNFCYDQGIFKSVSFRLPIISVGNLTVGGTGKTPHVEFLLRLLKSHKTATLSRGYKRNTRGFLLASPTVSAATIGDEPYQYYLDFPEVTVAVCEKRVTGIQEIQKQRPETEVIILDDAFQHRAVSPKLNLLITDFYRRFDTDFMMPTGLLREPRSGAKRADAVLVSKCPATLTQAEKNELKNGIGKYTKPGTPVFFTYYKYAEPVAFGKTVPFTKNLILVTGIANTEPLVRHLTETGHQILMHLSWPDHYFYTSSDLERIAQTWQGISEKKVSVLTTRKDAVKFLQPEFRNMLPELPFFYLPIEVEFLENQAVFEAMIINAVQANVTGF